MSTQTVRITTKDHASLSKLSRMMGKSMTATLSDAIDALARQQVLQRTNDAYAALKSDAAAWRDERRERELWDHTLADGLEES